MNPGEFPHSEISGSMLICSSPKLIAAYHVFHRLPVPRHSPCALVRLTFQTFFQNIWYPLDSLFCQRRLLLPFLLKLQYFLKELTIIFLLKNFHYNLCSPETLIFIMVWTQFYQSYQLWPMWWRLRESNPFAKQVPPSSKSPFQGPQNRTISTLLVSVTCSRWPTIFDVLPSA